MSSFDRITIQNSDIEETIAELRHLLCKDFQMAIVQSYTSMKTDVSSMQESIRTLSVAIQSLLKDAPAYTAMLETFRQSALILSESFTSISDISANSPICEPDPTASEDLKVRAINNSEVLLGYVESTDTSGVSTSMLDTLSKMREHPVSIRSLCRVIYEVIMLLLTVLALLQDVLPDQTMEDIKCLLEQQVEIMSEAAENLPPEEAEYFDCEILQC